MEQMELREALGEVRGADDPWAALDNVGDRIRAQDRALMDAFQAAFDSADIETAKDAVLKMKFYRRLQEELERLEGELEDELA